MVQTQGDAIMSHAMGSSAHAEMPHPDCARPCHGKKTSNQRLRRWRLLGKGKHAPQMIRFGARGKSEGTQVGAIGSIRAHLGARSIVLVGMPGSGKSAVGRRLAARLDLAFLDADEEIEVAAGKAITDIFKDHGEPYFREGERKVIARILKSGSQVLATGGGAFMSTETRDNIRASAVSVWLKAELPLLLRRVLKRNNRPLLERDPEGVMRSLVETRYPIYALADITVESRDLPHDVMVFEIIEALAAHGAPRPAETAPAQPTTSPGEPI